MGFILYVTISNISIIPQITLNTKSIKYVIIQQFLIIVFVTQLHKDVSALLYVAMELLIFTMSKCTNTMNNTLSLCNHMGAG